jgi:hypothetical protein
MRSGARVPPHGIPVSGGNEDQISDRYYTPNLIDSHIARSDSKIRG